MKSLYINTMRGARSVAGTLGILGALERSPSRNAQWLRSLFSIYDSADLASLDVPWWTYGAIDEVESFLRNLDGRARVFEYGAGASTLWLAKRCASVASVEHDVGFSKSMKPLFDRHANIRLMVAPDEASTGKAGEARSLRHGYLDRAFDDYVASIDGVPGDFDLIVVDGRARNACMRQAIPHLAPGGILLYDNSDRDEYRQAIDGCGLVERILRGRAPALPFGSQTSLLQHRT